MFGFGSDSDEQSAFFVNIENRFARNGGLGDGARVGTDDANESAEIGVKTGGVLAVVGDVRSEAGAGAWAEFSGRFQGAHKFSPFRKVQDVVD